jgi:F1F0 ATPase subunit 2
MSEAARLFLSGLAGALLGGFFFGGLWWTVRKSVSSARPAQWLLGSALLRMGVAVTGLYLVSGHHWQRLLACLLGFMAARAVVTRWTRPLPGPRIDASAEAKHAP